MKRYGREQLDKAIVPKTTVVRLTATSHLVSQR